MANQLAKEVLSSYGLRNLLRFSASIVSVKKIRVLTNRRHTDSSRFDRNFVWLMCGNLLHNVF